VTTDVDCAPLLHALPEDLLGDEAMFRALGVRAEFDGADYVLALSRLAQAAGVHLKPSTRNSKL